MIQFALYEDADGLSLRFEVCCASRRFVCFVADAKKNARIAAFCSADEFWSARRGDTCEDAVLSRSFCSFEDFNIEETQLLRSTRSCCIEILIRSKELFSL